MSPRLSDVNRRILVDDQPIAHVSEQFPRAKFGFDRATLYVGIVIICLGALNITSVLHGFGTPLALIAAVAAVFNPFAAFLYVAASQISPDPPNLPLTLAQLFVIAWMLSLPFNGCLGGLKAVFNGMWYMAPFIGLWVAFGFINGTMQEDWVYAFITCGITCTYIPQAKGQHRFLLWMLVLGASLGTLGHWGTELGLEMEGKVYDHFVRGGTRLGSGRADVNFASVNIGFALWTSCALVVSALWLSEKRASRWKGLLVLPILIIGAIPLLAMGSRGGLGYLVIGGIALGACLFNLRLIRRRIAGPVMVLSIISLAISPYIWTTFNQTRAGEMLLATLAYNSERAQNVGSNALEAGRAEIWSKFFQIALDNPLAGVPRGTIVDMGEYGFAKVGVQGEGGTGHNVLIDIAAGRGFPAALLFLAGFSVPVVQLIRRQGLHRALPFVIAHVMVFLPFMNLSIANWKTFWALHALTSHMARTSREKYTAVGRAHGHREA